MARLSLQQIFSKSMNYGDTMEDKVRISEKPLLTLKEASMYTGIGVNKLREISDARDCNFVLFLGNKRMLKRERLVQYLVSMYSI